MLNGGIMFEIGSEFHYEEINERENLISVFERTAEKAGRYALFLRCGRDAIGFVADDMIARYTADTGEKDERMTVFMPALSCDSMVRPFEVRGFEVEYYRLKDNYTPDTDYLIQRIEAADNSGDGRKMSVLLMNYFGIADVRKTAEILRQQFSQLVIIEDVTHILMEPESYCLGDSPMNYQVGSIRKWMGIPDGAVAIAKEEFLMGALTGESDFAELRRIALSEKTDYLRNGDSELKAHFRKLLSDAEDSLEDGLDPYIISEESADYLENIDALTICERRYYNYHNLYALLSENPLCGKSFHLLPENEKGDTAATPFMLPIILDIEFMRRSAITEEGRNITRDAFEQILAKKGVYAPVLWPISDEAKKVCDMSKQFSENMLAFWIDQRYDRFHMERINEVLSEELGKL